MTSASPPDRLMQMIAERPTTSPHRQFAEYALRTSLGMDVQAARWTAMRSSPQAGTDVASTKTCIQIHQPSC